MKRRLWLFVASLLAIAALPPLFNPGAARAEEKRSKTPVAQSADARFLDFGDGTVWDSKTGLMWMKTDYWQMEGKWINWYSAPEFVQKMNHRRFGGYSDWRLPTPDEAWSLYDRRKRNTDKDGDKIFIDTIFEKGPGWGTWTSEEKKDQAVVISYKDEGGRDFQDKITATDAFLRLVRGPVSP
jgi:hypothetical protein